MRASETSTEEALELCYRAIEGAEADRAGDEVGDVVAEGRGVVIAERVAHSREHVGRLLAVALPDREQEPDELSADPLGHPRDHAEVDQREASVRGDDEVAGVRVGVQQPLVEQGVEEEREDRLGQGGAVDVEQPERADVGDLAPCDVLHRQHA